MKTYSQNFVRQVCIGFSIDLAKGVESVIHLKPVEFLGKIIIQELKVAIKEAKKDT